MGIICLYVLIQKSGQKTAKSHLCAMVKRFKLYDSPNDYPDSYKIVTQIDTQSYPNSCPNSYPKLPK